MSHPTQQPAQCKTDTFAVFRDSHVDNDLVLVGRVEVPRFSQPNASGERLDIDKRLSVAVHRAVERAGYPAHSGEAFMVLTAMGEPMKHFEYDNNPSISAVWDPEEAD